MSDKVTKLVDLVSELSVLEVAELVKALEVKFGVSAAPVAVAGVAAAAAAPAEEKTEFDVVVTDAGANKIQVIKAVRELKADLGLVEAKNLVEKTPAVILEGAKKEDADAAKAKLEAAGAKVELK
jgi:large subunit ribosomal protein L7/L12